MLKKVTVEEAQARLKELILEMTPADEVAIMIHETEVARLLPIKPRRPEPGLCKDMIIEISPDFDEPLDEMKKKKIDEAGSTTRKKLY